MSVALRSVDGVESVEVTLEDGMASIVFAPAHAATIEQVRQIIVDNGFTPKDAEVRIAGRLALDDAASAVLVVPGQAVPFRLQDHDVAAGVVKRLLEGGERDLVIEGVVPEVPRGEPSRVILVRGLVESTDSDPDDRD